MIKHVLSEELVSNSEKNEDRMQLPRPAAVKRTLEIFSDQWSFSVLQEVFFGVRRFDDFQRNLKISRSVLTRRLRHLEEQKILQRKLYRERPDRYEYRLTERGRDMYPIFFALRQWGESWLDDAQTPELKLTHDKCGSSKGFQMVCGSCNEKVSVSEIHFQLNQKQT